MRFSVKTACKMSIVARYRPIRAVLVPSEATDQP